MNKTRSDNTAPAPAEPTPRLNPRRNDQERSPGESLSLSPDRIARGASTTTGLLAEILAQTEQTGQVRHWGINE